MSPLDYPAWLRVEHWLNVLFITLLIRSGIEILSSWPKLHTNDHCDPGAEFARFTHKTMPKDKLWDSLDEEESYSPIVSLPGRKSLGMGRHWHFISLIGWILVGAAYYGLLFGTGQWRRYIPYSPSIFAAAYHDILSYLSFHLPPLLPGQPLDAIQKLTYAAVIFLLAPFQILTGAAQSPAIEARFPWYVRMWGGRQRVRTLHFLGLIAFIVFIAIHLIMIGWWGWADLNALMIFGAMRNVELAFWLSFAIIAAIVLIHVVATIWSLKAPSSVQHWLGLVIIAARRLLLRGMRSRQHYSPSQISANHKVNGKPPDSESYKILAVHGFVDWRLEVGGMVENPMTFSLADLRAMKDKQNQLVMHNCIQGWTSIGEWGGVPLRDIIELVRPLPHADHICFLTMQDTGRDDPSAAGHGQFYEIIDLHLAYFPQCLLAYEMNGRPLPIEHGAPLRLRLENQVGFKMAKWIERIEFISAYSSIGEGKGGWREDNVHYDKDVEI